MSRITVRHIIALALMGVFLLGTLPGPQAYVWCVKEKGSSAFELGAHGECAPSSHQHEELHYHSNPSAECCGTSTQAHRNTCELCIDVSLDAEISKAPTPQLKKFAPAQPLPHRRELQRLRDLDPQFTWAQLPHPPLHISSTLVLQRTTVLII